MHFANDIFDANSYQDLFRTVILHFARQTLVFFENSQAGRIEAREGFGDWLGPSDCSFEAFNAPKSEILKADCSELAFKNVLAARAGSTILQNDANELHQSKQIIENAFCK